MSLLCYYFMAIIIFVCKDTIFVGKKKIMVKNIIKQLVLFFVFFVFEMLSFSFFFVPLHPF